MRVGDQLDCESGVFRRIEILFELTEQFRSAIVAVVQPERVEQRFAAQVRSVPVQLIQVDLPGDCLVPPLLLQPLVENALVHGVAQLVADGTIRMASSRRGEILTITIENPCDPDRQRTRGIGLGLDLLKRRVAGQFGAAAAVSAGETAGQFRVELRLPAVTGA